MKVFSIASGSSGNCVYVETEQIRLLFDAGISAKRIVCGLQQNGIEPDTVNAIFITHEHSDHIAGLSVLLKKYRIPIYGTAETLQAIMMSSYGKDIAAELLHSIRPGTVTILGDAEVSACYTSHDAAKPVCYSVVSGNRKFAMATDLGYYDDSIVNHLKDADILYLESNYDRDMLLVGTYPYQLKRRIMGPSGHLSNEDCAALIVQLLHNRLQYVILAHLSKENNYPELAFVNANNTLNKNWHYREPCPKLIVASRDEPIDSISI